MRHIACIGENGTGYTILIGRPEGKDWLETMHRWEDSIKMDLGEIGWKSVGWVARCMTGARDSLL
jgi:hypothetical protein